jgi:hypothetical protein
VFATHSDAGLECFNQVRWRMDPYRGRHVSEKRGLEQPGLFDDTPVLTTLRAWLKQASWARGGGGMASTGQSAWARQ